MGSQEKKFSVSLSNIKFLSNRNSSLSRRSLSAEQRRAKFADDSVDTASSKSQKTNFSYGNLNSDRNSKQRFSNTSIGSAYSEHIPEVPTSKQTYLIRSFNEIKEVILSHVDQMPEGCKPLDKSEAFRAKVRQSIMENKIFACSPRYPAIRKALERRGWVEKIEYDFTSAENSSRTSLICSDNFSPHSDEDELDWSWMNRILKYYPPDFMFKYWRDKLVWELLLPEQIMNQHVKSYFTNKISITDRIQESHWISEVGLAHSVFPRCYRLSDDEERTSFINDYRLTACLGLLEWVVQAYESGGDGNLIGTYGSPSACIDTAVAHVNNYVRIRKHEDLDGNIGSSTPVNWDLFLSRYHNAVFLKRKLTLENGQTSLKDKCEVAKNALASVKQFWPQRNIDGKLSMWICKPGAQARGRGIVVMNQLEKILNLLNESPNLHWVVQKYIERPLLVHNTKFDIRQWFLVSSWRPLTVWFYKECYLRFCSKPFDIDDFHESIHLCNNVVQSRYDISKNRDPALPRENMWDNKTFENHLCSIHQNNLWSEKISPGMKQGILAVLLATLNHIDEDTRRNCFEIYGADFMLSEDLTPWIIEINRSPCMEYTTDVTSRLCRQCLEDCIKVIIDRRENPTADTGLFELIYQGEPSSMPFKSQDPNEANLVIHGKGVHQSETQSRKLPSGNSTAANPRALTPKLKSTTIAKSNEGPNTGAPSKQTTEAKTPTLFNSQSESSKN